MAQKAVLFSAEWFLKVLAPPHPKVPEQWNELGGCSGGWSMSVGQGSLRGEDRSSRESLITTKIARLNQ